MTQVALRDSPALKSFSAYMLTSVKLAALVLWLSAPAQAYDEKALKQLAETGHCQVCDLSDADLRNFDLRNADLSGANLENADLRGASLRGTVLISANLSGADLTGAFLSGTFIRGTRLCHTTMPDGVKSLEGC